MKEMDFLLSNADVFEKRIPQSPFQYGDTRVACPCCGTWDYLHNADLQRNKHCGNCGQALDWGESK